MPIETVSAKSADVEHVTAGEPMRPAARQQLLPTAGIRNRRMQGREETL